MSNFNFTGAQAAEEMEVQVMRTVEPGFQKLTIVGIEDTVAGTGTKGLEIEFKSDVENTYTFKQKFWLNNADGSVNGGMPSFLYLVKAFTGAPIPETVNSTQAISALLVGKTVEATVGGEKRTREVDGKKYNNIYPRLPFAGWEGDRGNPYISGQWDSDSPTESSNSEDSFSAAEEAQSSDLPF